MDTSTSSVLTKDERLMQKEMIQMYHEGKDRQAVIQQIINKEIEPARAAYLAERYREDYEFIIQSKKRKAKQGAEINIIVGSVLIAGGLAWTILTYIMANGGGMLVLYGVILSGIGFLIKGLMDKYQK